MEEKKLDTNSLIGFMLIGAILLYTIWQNQPSPEQLAAQENQETQVESKDSISELKTQSPSIDVVLAQEKSKLGDFAYSLNNSSSDQPITFLENDVLSLKIDNKGGMLTEVRLKEFVNFDSVPVFLIKDGTSKLNLKF